MDREIHFEVVGFPPAKNEAISMFSPKHSHATRIIELLKTVRIAMRHQGFEPFDANDPIGLEVVLHAEPGTDPWDATNYLGGIGDALEDKTRRQQLEHLGELVNVFLYFNDRQIREVHYRLVPASRARYVVRVWGLI